MFFGHLLGRTRTTQSQGSSSNSHNFQYIGVFGPQFAKFHTIYHKIECFTPSKGKKVHIWRMDSAGGEVKHFTVNVAHFFTSDILFFKRY